jgi:two-component system chemotaxis response regulator CheB
LKRLKVLVADSSVIARKVIAEAVNATEYGIVEHTASNCSIAVEWLKQCHIDVILVDMLLIGSGNKGIIKSIKNDYPNTEIIIMSNDSPDSPSLTLELLKAGAFDFIEKPSERDLEKSSNDIKNHLQSLFIQIELKKYSNLSDYSLTPEYGETGLNKSIIVNAVTPQKKDEQARNTEIWGNVDLILVASSTGGPVALDVLCRKLPAGLHIPILIVQHMPPEFTSLLAQSLDKKYLVNVSEGKDRDIVKKDHIFIAPGGKHMIVENFEGAGKIIRLIDTAYVNGVKPSADVLFQSVARVYRGKNILAAILTGMGNDGTKGIAELKNECKCYCITQSEATCVVYGMPKCVYDAGLSDEVTDLEDIASRIYQISLGRGGKH